MLKRSRTSSKPKNCLKGTNNREYLLMNTGTLTYLNGVQGMKPGLKSWIKIGL